MLQIGTVIDGKYKILSKIGQGGMSIVYMAINERANKTWAVKEIRRDGIQDYEVVRQGLKVETELLKRLEHPNLPSIVDVIEDENTFLIVMDYIEGKTLSYTLREFGAQCQEDVVGWAKQLCDVLGYLHSKEPAIIYRDMKPSNVMLKPDGTVMLIDFGIAREYKRNHSADTAYLGTRGYAAPEQYGGYGQTDARTDIYCLGATMYHLLTGHNPGGPPYKMYPVRYWKPELSSGLEKIIMKCTRENPEERFQSCAELRYALNHYHELDLEYRKQQRKRFALFMASILLTVFMASGAVGFHMAEKQVRQSNYEQYMTDARMEEDSEERFACYMRAIALRPSDETAYCRVLEEFLLDSNFSKEEQKKFREMLGDSDGDGRTNREQLKTNPQGYHQFCREAAMAYFYYVENGQKEAALEWLQEIRDSRYLKEADLVRVELLYKIASYYQGLASINLAGDVKKSYREYWRDLTALTTGNITFQDNAMTALVVYREVMKQIYSHCVRFKKDGVTERELSDEMNRISERMKNEVVPVIKEEENSDMKMLLENMKLEVEELMDRIRTQILGTVYEQQKDDPVKNNENMPVPSD